MKELMVFCQQAFSWTWKTSVQAALLVVLILLLQKFLERWLTPRLRYALSFLVLCRLLLPVPPASRLSVENLLVRTAKPTATQPAYASSPRALTADLPLGSVGLSERPGFPLVEAFGVVWFCGFLGLLCCGGWRYRRWRHLVRGGERISDLGLLAMIEDAREAMGVSCPVALVSVPQLSSPAVFGFWRVCLLLPETALLNLNPQELRLVFMHEMAHVRRKDSLLNVVIILVQLLHWFNPLVWLGLHRLRADRELVCDAMVMRRAGEEARLGYGRLLIKLVDAFRAAHRVFPSAVPAVGSKQGMKRRILSIKNHGRSGLLGALATGVASVVLVCATFTGASEHPSLGAQGIAPATNMITATNGAIVHFGQDVLAANSLTIDLDAGQLVAKGSPLIRWPLQSGDQPWIGEHSPSGEQHMSSITNSITVSNGVVVHFGRSVLTARRMTINPDTGQVLAEGWRLQTSGQSWTGEHLDFNYKTNELRASPDRSSR